MILQPYSFDGNSLQSSDFEASIPRSSPLAQLEANLIYTKRMGSFPLYSGKDIQPTTITLEIKLLHSTMTLLESLNTIFNVSEETPKVFICRDTQDSNRQYFVYATPKRVMGGHDGQMATVVLGLDDAVWQTSSQNSQIWNITASGDSTDFTNSGNIDAYPIFEIVPTAYASGNYIYNNYIEYIPQQTITGTTWVNRPLEILADTNGIGMDTAALVAGGKALASGNDFRVYVNNDEVNRWFGGAGFNTTDTKCWINIPIQYPKITFSLKTAIDSTSPSTDITIEFTFSTTAKNNFTDPMPASGLLKIDNEEFLYVTKNITSSRIYATDITRAHRNTTASAHSVGAVVTWIPYDINLVYGSTAADAPDVDDTLKPIINLTTSNNSSFVYASFQDLDLLRSGIFSKWAQSYVNEIGGEVVDTETQKSFYTGVNNGGDTDPADVMGLYASARLVGSAYQSGTVNSYWFTKIPDGISTVTYTYERYQYTSQAPSIKVLTAPVSGTWVTSRTYPILGTTDLQTWVTGTDATSDLTVTSNAIYLRFNMSGLATAIAGNKIFYGITSLTVGITNPPTLSRRGEQDHYTSIFVLSNTQTGQSVTIRTLLHVGDTLIVETDPNFPTAKLNKKAINSIISLNEVRPDWLPFAVGTNTITATADTMGAITITVKWRDRMNFL